MRMDVHNPHTQDAAFGVLGFIAGSVQSLFMAGASAFFTGACSAAGAIMLHWLYRKFVKKKPKDQKPTDHNNPPTPTP